MYEDVVERWNRVTKCSEMVKERVDSYKNMEIKDVIMDIKRLVETMKPKYDCVSWNQVVVDWDHFTENATAENTTLVVKPEATILEEGMIKIIHELVITKDGLELILGLRCIDDGVETRFEAKVIRFGKA